MTEFKRQFDQDNFPPIVITIIRHGRRMVLLRQGDNKIFIEQSKIKDFAEEIHEVKRWSTST